MSKFDDDLGLPENIELRVHPRPSVEVSFSIPQEILNTLNEIAVDRDMSLEALLKFYIGKGLRHDRSQRLTSLASNPPTQVSVS